MEQIVIHPQRTCSRQILIEHEDGIIKKVTFTGGCPGNTTGLSALLVGIILEEAVNRLDGINCGNRGTSCPDQLAKGVKEYLNNK